jgi:outer membrane protein OmpA-like peptidoglycan-associated protein
MKSLAFLAITLAATTASARPGPDFIAAGPPSTVPRGLAASSGTAPIDPGEIVPFDLDSAQISEPAQVQLDATAQWLRHHKGYRLVIEGHTDLLGTVSYNEQLSQRRAQAVYDGLVHRGIDPDRLMMALYGEYEAQPVVDAGDRQVAMFATTDELSHVASALLDHRKAIATVWTRRGAVFSETRNPQISRR